MTDVCIYTANYGGYDTPRGGVDQDIDVEWRYFTDDGDARDAARALGWAAYQMGGLHPQPMMAAKWWKMHAPVGYEYAIWIDANMEVKSPSFAREAVGVLDGRGDPRAGARFNPTFAVWQHPRRDDFFDEIEASLGAESQDGKYDSCARRMIEQGDAYLALGMRRHTGLYACGTIVWTPEAWPLARVWWDECCMWTPQDQVSLPFVCWALDTYPAVFPVPQIEQRRRAYAPRNRPAYLENRWMRIWPHGLKETL